jgi:hypothetical protein
MNKLIIPATAAALLAASSLGFAATQHHTTGSVKTYDSKAMTLALDDGSTYMLPNGFKDPGIKVGGKVNVAWEQSGATKRVDGLTLVK